MKKVLYINSPDSKQVYVWKTDHNKYLKLLQIVNTPGEAQHIVIHPNKKNLYVGIRQIPKIVHFNIKEDGSLNEIEEFEIPTYATHLTINVKKNILYSASYKTNSLNVIQLDDTGNYISISQTLVGLIGCHSSEIEITKNRLWIPCLNEDCIRLYNLNKQGTLNNDSLQKINIARHSGPRHMVFHHSYNYAYVINELNSSISVIKINTSINHIPKIIQTIDILPHYDYQNTIQKHWASDIHITPDSQWIYCSDRGTNTISYLEISNNNKTLQFRGYQKTETQPRGFIIDKKGEHLFVAGKKSNFISMYKINKNNGELTLLFRFPSGEAPTWIAILDEHNN